MIAVQNVSVEFSGNVLFENVSFNINYGEKIGLVGRNGSGKSTLFKLITKTLHPSEGYVEVPEYYTIGHLDQHLKFSHSEVLKEVCSILPPEREADEWKGAKILSGLGFTSEQMFMDPKNLSGGWQVKVNLAKMLLSEPNMLLLDEPTNYLDIYSIRWLGEFLKKWDGELVLITHDRAFLNNVITHSLIIHRNDFKKVSGTPEKMKEQIQNEEEIYEKTRINEAKKRKETEDWIRKFGSKASKASAAQSRIKMLDKQEVKQKLETVADLDFKFNHVIFNSWENMMEVQNLTFGYEENNILIKDLTFKVEKDDKICIIGKNGNGKSTLLQLLMNQIKPINGEIKENNKVEKSYFSQMNDVKLNHDMSICEELSNSNSSLSETEIRRVCAQMLFRGDFAHKKIGVLSGGEKSRVMLGKILLHPSNLLLLDEPTNHLDMESSESLMRAIKEFENAVIMVTHNEYFLREIATKLIIFDGGKTFCYNGGYDDFLKDIGWAE